METNTDGIVLNTRRRGLVDAVELASSMRFAISLFVLIAIAAIIGTVMKQGEQMPNYVNQFGPFWFEVFNKLGLYAVYSTWWFVLIMGFLVLSTSLCIIRNAPKMVKDMRSWRENVREQSLRNFHHKAEWTSAAEPAAFAQDMAERLAASGYKVKLVEKDQATLIAAKQGAANKWGYIFAHGAIVMICLGGLLDSDLPIRLQEWLYGKTPFVGNGVIAQIPARHKLGLGNPTFRAYLPISEGESGNTARIPRAEGILLQEMPFTIELKKFVIDYYSTGMPKLFSSEVMVFDHETRKRFPATIKVNEPLIYKGLAVYQSSFEDGGSKLKLTAYPMTGAQNKTFQIAGEVSGSTPLSPGKDSAYTVEWSGFRPFNIENMAQSGQDVRAVNPNQSFNQKLSAGLDKRLGSAAKNVNTKEFKNIGPSVQYKLRDQTGQAREFNNYMMPVLADGIYVFHAGVRTSPSEPFSFLRIPADDNDSVEEWMRLRAAIMQPALRARAAQRYVKRLMASMKGGDVANLAPQLEESALRGMTIFAGNEKESGFIAVSKFIEALPAAEQKKAAEIFLKILNASLWELWQVAREQDGLKPVVLDEKHARFLQVGINAFADSFFYGAPVFLQLKEFTEVKASVFQVTRSPGKNVVYLGCLFLVLGVFSMLYIRERRLWVWLRQQPDGKMHALMAMSSQRKTLDFDREFEVMKDRLSQTAV
jgi:cytochrome c biogenesis protein